MALTKVTNDLQDALAAAQPTITSTGTLTGLTVTGEITANGGAVFNEASADVDFRVESNDNANMLFVDGGSNAVSVGMASVPNTFNVLGGHENTGLYRDYSGAGVAATYLNIGRKDTNGALVDGLRISGGGDDAVAASHNGYFEVAINRAGTFVPLLSSTAGTELVINDSGVDADFRVESDTNTHALFVDASTNRVGLFTNAPAAPLEVYIGASSSADADGLNLTNSGENGSNLNFKNAFGTMVQIKGTKQGGGGLADEGLIEIRTAVNGTLTGGVRIAAGATSWSSISDERLKDIIEPITNAAEKVSTLRAVIGSYKTDPKKTRRPFLIAQDIQAVLPEAVDDTDENELSLRYTETIPLLVAAIQEQQELIKTLEARIAALES